MRFKAPIRLARARIFASLLLLAVLAWHPLLRAQLPSAPQPSPHSTAPPLAASEEAGTAAPPKLSAGTPSEFAQAHAFIDAGSLHQADALMRTYLARDINSADGHFLLGYILFREEKPTDSLAEYTYGAKFHTPSEEDLKIVAFDYVLLKDYADASKWLSKAVAWKPSDADAWYYLGRAKYNENRFKESIDAFQHALALSPHSVRAEDNLGLAYLGLQHEAEANTAFRNAIDWQANALHQDPQPYLNLGTLLVQQGKAEEALSYLQRAAAISNSNPKMHEQLGQAYTELKDLDKAKAEFETAVSLAPEISGLHFKLGQIYQKQGLKDQAKKEFDRCAQLNASHSSEETPNPY